jgi:ketopantoate reductase
MTGNVNQGSASHAAFAAQFAAAPQGRLAPHPGALQVRRAEGEEVHGMPERGGAQVAEMQPAARASLILMGGTGSQGLALAYAASTSRLAGSHDRAIVIPVRGDAARIEQIKAYQVDRGGQRISVNDMHGVSVIPMGDLAALDLSNSIVVVTTPSWAHDSVLRSIPGNPKTVILETANGVPSELSPGVQRPEHVVSVFGSREMEPGVFTFTPGTLVIDASSRVADDFEKLFGSTWTVARAPNILVAQWSKIGANTIVNSLATILGLKVMDLRKMINDDPNVAKLVKGLCAEIWMVARQQGVPGTFEDFHDGVIAKIPPGMDHLTSMGLMFRGGKSLDPDISTLSAGVSRLAGQGGDEGGVPTPLCDALTGQLGELQALRGDVGVGNDFYDRPEVAALKAQLLSPEMLVSADGSLARAMRVSEEEMAAAV